MKRTTNLNTYNLDKEGYAIPFVEVQRLTDALIAFEPQRIAVLFLVLTGMRVSELNKLTTSSFVGDYVIWKTGKNQRGYRKEKLPGWFLQELDHYMLNHSFVGGKLFSFNANTLNRFINMKIRPTLGGCWLKRRTKVRGSVKIAEFIYQLKGMRHNFQTLDFANNLEKWGKDVAIEFTSKRMHHSSYKMTARHYIQNFEELGVNRYKGQTIGEILKQKDQRLLVEFIA